MGRGIFSGLLWGSVFSVVGLWMVSQLGGMIYLLSTPPEQVETQPPAATQADRTATEDEPTAPRSDASPATEPSRAGVELSQGTPEKLPTADTQPAGVPQTGDVADTQAEPTQNPAPKVDLVSEVPTQPSAGSAAPVQPNADPAPEPAQTAPARSAQLPDPVVPLAPVMPGVDSQGRPPAQADPVVVGTHVQPDVPQRDDLPAPDITAALQPPKVTQAPAVTAPVAQTQVPEIKLPEPQDVVPKPEAEEIAVAPDEGVMPEIVTETAPAPQTDKAPKKYGLNVRTGQLPTIGAAATSVAPTAPQTEEPSTEQPATGPAIQQFAAQFENPDNQPVMAIVLIDEGGARPSRTELEDLPFPVSYAVDANRPDAGQAMADYRAAGREVIALAPLPKGARPADVEVAFQTYMAAMPEVVALMDTRDGVFQSGRQVTTQVAEILAASGHGMITYSRGMNAATQVASRQGVPARLVFREFDDAGQDSATIKRFLDQAALKAGQITGSGVVLVGHNRPETIKTLVEWSLGNKAETVVLAPVSAALQVK